MNNKYSKNTRVCATCNFWQGQRSFTSTLRNIVDVTPGSYGDCLEGAVKKTQKMNNATCSKWQRWSAIRSDSSNNKSSEKSKNKGTIPYPIFVALILLVAVIQFIQNNLVYFVSICSIVIICTITCFLIYRKSEKPKYKMLATIFVGIVLIIAVFLVIPNIKKTEIQAQQNYSEETIQRISIITVSGGYKPCFGTGNVFTDESKIVIFGAIEYNSISNVFNIAFADNQIEYSNNLTPSRRLPLDTAYARTYLTNNGINLNNTFIFPYYGLIFLTKNDNVYLLDNVIPLDRNNFKSLVKNITSTSIMQYSNVELSSVVPALDTWILENADK